MPDDKPPVPTGSPDGIATGTPAPPSTPVPAGAVTAEPMNVPPIPLGTAPTAKPSAPPIPIKKDENKDTFRELIETIVFVVVLVLMLKTFLAEAFVIPTGSMGVTLLGYHHKVVCKECGYTYLGNASMEADPEDKSPVPVTECWCENCDAWNRTR